MGDKSAYMSPGGYSSAGPGGYSGGYQQQGGGYAREEYAYNTGGSGSSGNTQQQCPSSGSSGNAPGVTKPRTDVSCYLGP